METKILILAVVDTTEGAIFESAGGISTYHTEKELPSQVKIQSSRCSRVLSGWRFWYKIAEDLGENYEKQERALLW